MTSSGGDIAGSSVRWLFLDMNSFFASVEEQEHPELRGRPLAITPVEASTTVCIAANAKARAFGIETGTSVQTALRRCPALV